MAAGDWARERFRGCILGLAIGDALGMPWEFMSAEDVGRMWNGEDYARGRAQPDLGPGQYTDDTQSMRCLLESLASCGALDVDDFGRRLVDWYRTGDLRGMGGNSLAAIQRLAQGAPPPKTRPRGKRGATNGAAMRVAPIGLFFCEDDEGLRKAVDVVSGLTHRHRDAQAGALAVAFAVAHSVSGDVPPGELLAEASAYTAPSHVSERLDDAQRLLEQGFECADALRELGTTALAWESVPAALYCACDHPSSYKEAVVAAVRGGGDTDTMGAMAGAVTGARLGLEAIPAGWVRDVEDSKGLLLAADALFDAWQRLGA